MNSGLHWTCGTEFIREGGISGSTYIGIFANKLTLTGEGGDAYACGGFT